MKDEFSMTKHEYKQNAYYLIYLIRCLLHNRIPVKEKLDKMNLSQLYNVASAHSLTAIIAYALESAGIYDMDFEEAKNKSIRKNIILDAERKKVLEELEKAGVWYMPLKGSIIKDYYPKIGMRQMADSDVLCDETKMDKVKDIMLSCRFETVLYGKSHQDIYHKPPVCNFEMHSRLFEPRHQSSLYKYYNGIKNKLLKDDNNKFGYHFSDEDFYIFLISHEYKHFKGTGTGLRSLLDTYVFLKKTKENLNWDYIDHEMELLSLSDFEKKNKELAFKVFEHRSLSKEDKEFLDFFIFSGAYGIIENRMYNYLGSDVSFIGKLKYAIMRAMVPEEVMKEYYPFFYSHKLFRPALYFYKVINKLCSNAKPMFQEIIELIKYK